MESFIGVLEIIAIVGFLLSLYSLRVEQKSESEKNYKAVCDVNDKISCTKAFSSGYGRIAYLPNSFYGVLFYLIVYLLSYLGKFEYVFYLSVLSLFGSIYLAFVLYSKVKSFCIVCSGIYVVNILLLVFSAMKVY